MLSKSIGFIGGGRITKIFIERMSEAGILTSKVIVSDTNETVLADLKRSFSSIEMVLGNNKLAAHQDYVFVSLHPPVLINALEEIKNDIQQNSILISLAPKVSIAKIKEVLNGFNKIIRMNPNSPSVIGSGFNPVHFSSVFLQDEKEEMKKLFTVFGNSPEVEETLLETYAVITAMGPTYLQFQFEKLAEMAEEFGIPKKEVKETIVQMVEGALKLWATPKFTFEEVYNMIPVKPMAEDEEIIRASYSTKLNGIFNKLKN